jgi:hypothetical protein
VCVKLNFVWFIFQALLAGPKYHQNIVS